MKLGFRRVGVGVCDFPLMMVELLWMGTWGWGFARPLIRKRLGMGYPGTHSCARRAQEWGTLEGLGGDGGFRRDCGRLGGLFGVGGRLTVGG